MFAILRIESRIAEVKMLCENFSSTGYTRYIIRFVLRGRILIRSDFDERIKALSLQDIAKTQNYYYFVIDNHKRAVVYESPTETLSEKEYLFAKKVKDQILRQMAKEEACIQEQQQKK